MTWSELDWPDLSPDFPTPSPASSPPVRPDAPEGVAQRIHAAEVTRGIVVPLCALAGGLLLCGGALASGRIRALGLALLGAGVLVAFVAPAVATLRIGPTWAQRQSAWQLTRWRRERRAWLARERAAYLRGLSPQQRDAFRRALAGARQPPAGG